MFYLINLLHFKLVLTEVTLTLYTHLSLFSQCSPLRMEQNPTLADSKRQILTGDEGDGKNCSARAKIVWIVAHGLCAIGDCAEHDIGCKDAF